MLTNEFAQIVGYLVIYAGLILAALFLVTLGFLIVRAAWVTVLIILHVWTHKEGKITPMPVLRTFGREIFANYDRVLLGHGKTINYFPWEGRNYLPWKRQ